MIAAVEGVIPVPKTWWLDATGEDLGRPAIIYGFVTGVQKPSMGSSNVTGVGIQFDREQRAAIGPQFIECLARIHSFSIQGVDLSTFDLPKIGTTQDIDGQINWWARVWEEDRSEAIPLLPLAEALRRTSPQARDAA